jgi:hypothetical protein
MKMAWKTDKRRGARRANKAMLARRAARHAFKAGMEDAFALCNEFLNSKEKFDGVKNWFDDLKPELARDFKYYAYYKYREIKYKESMFSKYRDMAELYREICISQDSCAEARESRQGMCFPGAKPAAVHQTQVHEPTARAMRVAGRV